MSDTRSIDVDYELPHPPEHVWRALTEPALLASWLMSNDLRAEVGYRFEFRAQPMPNWDGIVRCEVTEVVPFERLAYSWVGGSEIGPGGRLDTTVTWTLAKSAGGTKLSLSHAGFTEKNAFALENLAKGWRGMVGARMGQTLAQLA
jgi:uncharacterized protein YndB with AHSA1/START domain